VARGQRPVTPNNKDDDDDDDDDNDYDDDDDDQQPTICNVDDFTAIVLYLYHADGAAVGCQLPGTCRVSCCSRDIFASCSRMQIQCHRVSYSKSLVSVQTTTRPDTASPSVVCNAACASTTSASLSDH